MWRRFRQSSVTQASSSSITWELGGRGWGSGGWEMQNFRPHPDSLSQKLLEVGLFKECPAIRISSQVGVCPQWGPWRWWLCYSGRLPSPTAVLWKVSHPHPPLSSQVLLISRSLVFNVFKERKEIKMYWAPVNVQSTWTWHLWWVYLCDLYKNPQKENMCSTSCRGIFEFC